MSLRELRRRRPTLPRCIGGEVAASVDDLRKRETKKPRSKPQAAGHYRELFPKPSVLACQTASDDAGVRGAQHVEPVCIFLRRAWEIGLGYALAISA